MASSQPSTRTARPTSESRTDSATAPPRRARTWPRTGSALLPGGSAPRPSCPSGGRNGGGGAGLPWRQDRSGDAPLAQGGQRGLCGAPAVDHDGGDTRTRRGLEGGVPAVVDLDQVDERAHHSVDLAQQLAPARALQVRQRALQCLGPGRRPVTRLLGVVRRHLGLLRAVGDRLQLGAACGELGLEPRGGLIRLDRRLLQQVGPHGGARDPLLERADAGRERIEVLLLTRGGAGHQLRAGAHPGERLVGLVVAQDRRPPLPQRPHLPVERLQRRRQLCALGREARGLLGLGHRQLTGQACRLRLERRDHVDVGVGVERGHHGPAALAQHAREPPGPLHQALHPAQGIGQVLLAARRQLGGGGGGLGVELLESHVQLALLVPAHGQVLRRRSGGVP